MLTIPAWLRGDRERWLRWISVLLLVFVLVLNRRTVWLAILVGVAVLMLRDRQLGRRAVALVAFGAVVTVVAFVSLGGLQEGSQPVVKSGSGNLARRIEGWSELTEAWLRSPTNWALGEPFGGGFAREIEGTEEGSHPHNFYIETMIRTGLAGLVALIALTAGLLRALWRAPARDAGLLGPGVLPALLAMQLVWCLTWVPGSEQGIVTGLAVAAAAAHVSRRRPPARPTSGTTGPMLSPTARAGR